MNFAALIEGPAQVRPMRAGNRLGLRVAGHWNGGGALHPGLRGS
jgi:hypothetical protein